MEYYFVCPYCNKSYVLIDEEGADLICEDCKPQYETDLALADLSDATARLNKSMSLLSGKRKLLLEQLVNELISITTVTKEM